MKTGALETCFEGPKPHSPWPTDPSENPEKVYRVYRCPIPRYPFRLLRGQGGWDAGPES